MDTHSLNAEMPGIGLVHITTARDMRRSTTAANPASQFFYYLPGTAFIVKLTLTQWGDRPHWMTMREDWQVEIWAEHKKLSFTRQTLSTPEGRLAAARQRMAQRPELMMPTRLLEECGFRLKTTPSDAQKHYWCLAQSHWITALTSTHLKGALVLLMNHWKDSLADCFSGNLNVSLFQLSDSLMDPRLFWTMFNLDPVTGMVRGWLCGVNDR